MNKAAVNHLLESYRERFKGKKFRSDLLGIARAPGRVNLIGEHTDYNDGFVMPMAIDREILIAFRGREDRMVRVYSLDLDQEISFSLDDLNQGISGPEAYLQGVAWALDKSGYKLAGFEGVMHGNIPIGAGLSSSAALEVVTTRVFSVLTGFPWSAAEMARIAQRAENDWVGVNCGIMDQLSSAVGGIQLIDCRSLETTKVPLPSGAAVVVMDTGTRRGLVDSAYNERRQQCSRAAEYFKVPALRDVSLEDFTEKSGGLDPLVARRARHVVKENHRVLMAAKVMRADDAESLGVQMDGSHSSLRDDFEVSSPALDMIVEIARKHEACWGARMTGAGFGGCAVALVKNEAAEDFITSVAPHYQEATGHTPSLFVCHPAPGASFEPFNNLRKRS
jgi:galactokinase